MLQNSISPVISSGWVTVTSLTYNYQPSVLVFLLILEYTASIGGFVLNFNDLSS